MAQVRVAVLNGEFSPRRITAFKIAGTGYGKGIGPASAGKQPPTDRTDRTTRKPWIPNEICLPNFRTLSCK
jgi:hypothetical protein